MPKSKRNKVISLTKTSSKGREGKKKLVDSLRTAIDEYSSIYLFSFENFRTANFTQVRTDFKDSKIFLGKNSITQIAFGRSPEEEYKDNLRHMTKHMTGDCGLLYTNRSKKEVIKYFKNFNVPDYATAGVVLDEDIKMTPQILEQFPVQMLDELRKLGMKVEVEKGKVALRDTFVVCQSGVALTPEQARVLVKMEKKLINFKVTVQCYWEDGEFEEFG